MILVIVLFCPDSLTESSCFLNQVYSAAGLASLLQLRVTELPSSISPEGLTVTEGVFGASVMNTKAHVLRYKETCENSMYIYIHDSINDNENHKVDKFGLIINVEIFKLILLCILFTHI